MAEQIQVLDADTHLLLDQPLLRVPHELLRKNLKSAQRHVDSASKNMTKDISTQPSNSTAALATLDALLAKATNLQRKLEQLAEEEKTLHAQQSDRIAHLTQLHEISSLSDVAYEKWSHTRLDRLLVDHLLRHGHSRSARLLASEQDILPLVDLAVFEDSRRIEQSLLSGKTAECLAWCGENKQALKKMNSNLELELRLQQFIELARGGDVSEKVAGIVHARKHLAGGQEVEFGLRAGGLLAHESDTLVEPYRVSSLALPSLPSMVLITDGVLPDDVRTHPLPSPSTSLPQNSSLLAPTPLPTTSLHRLISRSLRTQDSIMPFRSHSHECRRACLSNLQHRIECSGQGRAVCTSYKEFHRRRPRRFAEWKGLRAWKAGCYEFKIRSREGQGERPCRRCRRGGVGY